MRIQTHNQWRNRKLGFCWNEIHELGLTGEGEKGPKCTNLNRGLAEFRHFLLYSYTPETNEDKMNPSMEFRRFFSLPLEIQNKRVDFINWSPPKSFLSLFSTRSTVHTWQELDLNSRIFQWDEKEGIPARSDGLGSFSTNRRVMEEPLENTASLFPSPIEINEGKRKIPSFLAPIAFVNL